MAFCNTAAVKPQLSHMQSWASTGRLTLKKIREFPQFVPQEAKRETNQSSLVVFCEKSSGVAQFRAESCEDEDLTVERVAGMLAMQCLVRGHDPDDFVVLVPAEKTLVGRLVSRAKDLLQEGRAIPGPTSLSPRQKEVLHSVICNRGNKEIASKLNITVRTVKFHISSLLCKFGVGSRTELARRAAGLAQSTAFESGSASPSAESSVEPDGASLGSRVLSSTPDLSPRMQTALPWTGRNGITATRS